ncbi:hypothetical protein [Micromonospora sp. C28ISP2-4]|uniref:hypothetical protein n=1 Tax=Micromonospora sp. C28ISP2-4 TaxID=3059523 RepID=UPI00267739C5|nr:hypothetical protein [Micromonospora sp. C28ISP2-4]MDO3686010.1 hypothetical protein [Micromonospora sp. C28ISP2-4]
MAPEQFPLDELGRSALAARHDPRSVVSDPDARYFGAALSERSVVPADGARIAGTRLDDWRTRAAHGRQTRRLSPKRAAAIGVRPLSGRGREGRRRPPSERVAPPAPKLSALVGRKSTLPSGALAGSEVIDG